MHIESLYRYPIKGFSSERLLSVEVGVGEGFPLDRVYALLRTDAAFDPSAPTWLAKANFVMLMLHETIAALQTRYTDHDKALNIVTPDGYKKVFKLDVAADRAALEQFVFEFLPTRLNAPPRLVTASGHQFTDKAAKFISLINLASLRALEQQWGQALDPRRFRANVYIDNAAPFAELDWVGHELRLGTIRARVIQRNGRCAATNVNPDTGKRDRDIPGKLRAAFGHKDLGIYLWVTQAGSLREGDLVEIAHADVIHSQPTAVHASSGDQLMCTACYYLFDPRQLDSSWIRPQDLPPSWRCPDCGATRESVVPTAAHQATGS